MIIYSSIISPRLRYTSDFIGKELSGKPFELTDRKEIFLQSTGPKINYSRERLTNDQFWLQPHSLLFEKDIRQQTINCTGSRDQKAFFKTGGDWPFDIFAATFYLISRYEEYLPHEKDMYGRYAQGNSLAFKEGFLDKPLVNSWLQEFKEKLREIFPSLTLHHSQFTFLPTYDVDEAWSFKHKSRGRTTGAAIKDLLKGNWKRFSLRQKVLKNKIQDPFDSYEWMDRLHSEYKLQPRYFFLLAENTGKYDRHILPGEPAMKQLIQQHAGKYETGIHPSWQTGDDPLLLHKEIAALSAITGKTITSSRQHYIRFSLPETFRLLSEAGITHDFSMGYGTINGFRASVASPFYWYDLERDAATELILYPFCYMEANSFFEQKYTAVQALEEMRHYYREVKKVNGTFISIWHNTFLGTGELFTGWREVYEQFIKEMNS